MNKKVFITRTVPRNGIMMLKEKGYEVDVYPDDRIIGGKRLVRTLKRTAYDAVLCLLTDRIDAAVFDAAPSVKMYANYATGFDNIDIAEATKRGIIIANAPSPAASEAVAEHAIALMLSLAARIVEADEFMRKGKYVGWSPTLFVGSDVLGKTLGLVGAGRIGERVARYAKGLGLAILYTDVTRNERIERECGAAYCGSLAELLARADIVSLHVPLMDGTKHLIDASALALMKAGSYLVNTSRGPIIDERALVDALRRGVIRGAALDVFEHEPVPEKGLTKCPNVILTPHIASASIAAREEMAEIAAHNIIDFFEGRSPRNAIASR